MSRRLRDGSGFADDQRDGRRRSPARPLSADRRCRHTDRRAQPARIRQVVAADQRRDQHLRRHRARRCRDQRRRGRLRGLSASGPPSAVRRSSSLPSAAAHSSAISGRCFWPTACRSSAVSPSSSRRPSAIRSWACSRSTRSPAALSSSSRHGCSHGAVAAWPTPPRSRAQADPQERARPQYGPDAARSRFSCDARLAPKPVDLSPRLRSAPGWPLVATPLGTEMGIDTCTPMGKAMAHMAAVFAELERDFIRMRTHEALQVKEENGVMLSRPRSTPDKRSVVVPVSNVLG